MNTVSEHKYQQSGFRMAQAEEPEAFAPHSHFILKNHKKWHRAREKLKQETAKRRTEVSNKTDLSKKQEKLIMSLLQDPETHDAVVQALGGADTNALLQHKEASQQPQNDNPDTQELSSEGTRVGDSPPPNAPKPEDRDASSGEATSSGKPPAHVQVAAKRQPKPRVSSHQADSDAPTVHGHAGDDDKGEKGEKGDKGDKGDKGSKPEDNRTEFKLLKSLVDRVTHLEAQSRQMLVDTMDEDLARTVLLADRNCLSLPQAPLTPQCKSVTRCTFTTLASTCRVITAKKRRQRGRKLWQSTGLATRPLANRTTCSPESAAIATHSPRSSY